MKDFFNKAGIEFYSFVPLSRCKILKKYLLEKNGFDENANAILFLIPYRSKIAPVNLSVYASVKDYHGFVKMLDSELEKYALKKYPNGKFKIFADHSPIDEVHGACISGLGFIGDNGLLINEKYSSFVFLAECITDLSASEIGLEVCPDMPVKECLHCGACMRACPSNCISDCDPRPKSECLSAITQKKGDLNDDEIKMMLDSGVIWGCDICQSVCPFTKNASFTPIEFFNENVISLLDSRVLDGLDDQTFLTRPFSWRGRDVIKRNVELYERSKKW
jgi:epoxyqueuosine reductase QueG